MVSIDLTHWQGWSNTETQNSTRNSLWINPHRCKKSCKQVLMGFGLYSPSWRLVPTDNFRNTFCSNPGKFFHTGWLCTPICVQPQGKWAAKPWLFSFHSVCIDGLTHTKDMFSNKKQCHHKNLNNYCWITVCLLTALDCIFLDHHSVIP